MFKLFVVLTTLFCVVAANLSWNSLRFSNEILNTVLVYSSPDCQGSSN